LGKLWQEWGEGLWGEQLLEGLWEEQLLEGLLLEGEAVG
jgi:hypothetical protein